MGQHGFNKCLCSDRGGYWYRQRYILRWARKAVWPNSEVKFENCVGWFQCKVREGRKKNRPTIDKYSLRTKNNGERLITYTISKNLLVKSTYFAYKDIHKYTLVSPDGKTLNQIDRVLVDRRRHTNIMDVRSYRGAESDTGHQLVIAKGREN